MSIIIEDGTIVEGANSYIDDAYLVSYATKRGLVLPDLLADREILIYNSMDYIETMSAQLKGSIVSEDQPLSFPRKGIYVNGFLLSEGKIPENIKKAQAQVAFESSVTDLFSDNDGTNVKKEKLGPLETEYFFGGSSSLPKFKLVELYLYDFKYNSNMLERT